jgi:predicted DNA-binding transcriptional regulator AlpA
MSSQLTTIHEYHHPAQTRFPVIQPRLISRRDAAEYLGIGTTTFDGLVQRELMPRPKTIGRRRVWDLQQIDRAIDELPEVDIQNQTVAPYDPLLDVAA